MPYTATPYFPAAAATRAQLIVAGNNDVLDLAADIDSVQATLQVGTGTGSQLFVGQAFVIDQEAFQITTIAGDLIGVTRQFDSTTASGHTAGTGKIVDRPIAKHHNQLADEVAALEAFLVGGADADFNMGGYRITNLGSPSTGSDAATRDYVDAGYATAGGPGRFTNLFLMMGA